MSIKASKSTADTCLHCRHLYRANKTFWTLAVDTCTPRVLIFKIGTIHPHELNERFWFISSLHSFCSCPAWADKSGDFSPFHSMVYVYVHLPPLIHLAPPPCLLIGFKNSKWLTYFCILLCIIMHFSSLLCKFTRFSIFSFSLTKGQCSKR